MLNYALNENGVINENRSGVSKGLLIAFEDSNEPHTSITRLLALGFDHRTNEFRFHIRLLHDRGLIGRVDGEHGIGYFSPK